jgi:hypothetical protein
MVWPVRKEVAESQESALSSRELAEQADQRNQASAEMAFH